MQTDQSEPLRQMRALAEAGVAVTSELSLSVVLQKVVEVARDLANARYAALSIVGEDAVIEQFVFTGISDEERELIGDLPTGHGLLGVIIKDGTSLRLDDLSQDPRSVGFPPNHPPMKSLLGVPVVWRGRVIGNLYLTEKRGEPGFSEQDEESVRLLAAQAAVAIQNAELHETQRRLQEQAESLALLHERERIAMDLHDGVIQSVYAVGLRLEDAAERAAEGAAGVTPVLNKAIEELHKVIKDIRSYIFDLRVQVSEVSDLPRAIRELAGSLRVNTLMDVEVTVPDTLTGISEDEALGLFHIAQEALNNVSKHSQATQVRIALSMAQGRVILEVQDNGAGFPIGQGAFSGKQGLRNMKDRARSLGAGLFVDSEEGKGTVVRVELPVKKSREEGDG